MRTNAVRPTPVPQLGEGTLTFDRFSRGCDPFCIYSIYCRGDSYGQEEETEIFARRRHGSEREMHRYKRGKAKSGKGGKGGKVKNRKQAIAIALSKARKKGKKSPVEEEIAY